MKCLEIARLQNFAPNTPGHLGALSGPQTLYRIDESPSGMPDYGPDIKKIEKIENLTFKKCYHCLKSIKHFSPCKNKFSDARIAIKITFPRLLILNIGKNCRERVNKFKLLKLQCLFLSILR